MKNLTKTVLALLATGIVSCALFSPHAQAGPITGQISFAGVVTLNTNNFLTSTSVSQWRDVFNNNPGFANVSGAPTGSFSGIAAGSLASFATPWTFGVTVGGPQVGLWSVGGFSFDLTSSAVTTRTTTDLIVSGVGILHGGGSFTDTAGTWNFHVSNASGNPQASFSFAASSSAVPDGGSAVALLGVALTGVEVLRRKFARK